MDRIKDLADSAVVTETDSAILVSMSVNTGTSGRQTATAWVSKEQSGVYEDGSVSICADLVEVIQERITAEHPEFGGVGLRFACDANQMSLLGE